MRAFIALPLPEGRRKALLAEMSRIERRFPGSGRFSRPGNLHLTLAFLGEIPQASAAELAAALARIPAERLRFTFRGLGTFSSARILWMGLEEEGELCGMAAAARRVLDSLGIAYDRKPFRAHVTLARDWRGPRIEELGNFVEKNEPEPASARPLLFESARDAAGRVLYRPVSG